MLPWPASRDELFACQRRLAAADPPPWHATRAASVGASYCCFARGAASPVDGETGWAAAVRKDPGCRAVVATADGTVRTAYEPGLLALREGPLREAAVRRLAPPPDLVVVDATGRDHPRRAGLAVQLGAVLGLPTVGVTDRPLAARGEAPPASRGGTSPLWLDDDLVGFWVRPRAGVRPVAAHAGWRTTAVQAVEVVLATATRARTPQPLREARRAARGARAAAGG